MLLSNGNTTLLKSDGGNDDGFACTDIPGFRYERPNGRDLDTANFFLALDDRQVVVKAVGEANGYIELSAINDFIPLNNCVVIVREVDWSCPASVDRLGVSCSLP